MGMKAAKSQSQVKQNKIQKYGNKSMTLFQPFYLCLFQFSPFMFSVQANRQVTC